MDKANARPKKAPTTINNLVDIILCCIVLSTVYYTIIDSVHIEVIEQRCELFRLIFYGCYVVVGHSLIVDNARATY